MIEIPNDTKTNDLKTEEGSISSQILDFSNFRIKNSDIIFQISKEQIIIKNNNNYFLSIIIGLGLIYNSDGSSQNIFHKINIINMPKAYINYANKQTLQQFYRILKSNINSLTDLAGIISYYPVLSFVLEIFGRQTALLYLRENNNSLQDILMGNQEDILNDFSMQLRGNTLDLVAKSLKVNLQIKYMKKDSQKFVRKIYIEQLDEIYGDNDYNVLVQVKHINRDTHFTILENLRQINKLKKPKMEFIQRKNKVKDGQLSRTLESRSIPKTSDCRKCGKQNCNCLYTRKILSPKNMPHLNKSLNECFNNQKVVIMPQQLNYFGFINLNKLIKN